MKRITQIISTIVAIYIGVSTVVQGNPYQVIGFFIVGGLIGASLTLIWKKSINNSIEDN